MTDELLYSFTKEECIGFLEDIEQRREAAGPDNIAYTFFNKTTKNGITTYYEIIDARSRLQNLDDKERLQNISQRLTALES